MPKQVFLAGSVAFDYLMRFPGNFNDHILPDQLERLSLSFLVTEMRKERGGIGANIAYSMALLGYHPTLFATVGQDFEEYRRWLEDHGVDTSAVKVIADKFTASFFANTDLGDRQISAFYAGAMGDSTQLSLHDHRGADIAFVVVSPVSPDGMMKTVRECKALGLPYIFDPSQQITLLTKEELIEGTTGALMLIVNDYELGLIEKKTGQESAELATLTQTLVITKGAEGSTVVHKGQVTHSPAVLIDSIADPIGGGDAFRGGFLRGYLGGADWETAAQMGALSATYCLEVVGTQNHSYTQAQYLRRFAEYFGDAAKVAQILQR